MWLQVGDNAEAILVEIDTVKVSKTSTHDMPNRIIVVVLRLLLSSRFSQSTGGMPSERRNTAHDATAESLCMLLCYLHPIAMCRNVTSSTVLLSLKHRYLLHTVSNRAAAHSPPPPRSSTLILQKLQPYKAKFFNTATR